MGKHDATILSKPLTSLQITPPSIHPAQVQQVILVSGKARELRNLGRAASHRLSAVRGVNRWQPTCPVQQ